MSRVQLSVTVSPEMGEYVEKLSEELGVKKSAVVEHALEVDRQRRKELLMREGYEEMAEHDAQLLREFEHLDSETPLPEYAEK
jgi:predicted transcriptional regulator